MFKEQLTCGTESVETGCMVWCGVNDATRRERRCKTEADLVESNSSDSSSRDSWSTESRRGGCRKTDFGHLDDGDWSTGVP